MYDIIQVVASLAQWQSSGFVNRRRKFDSLGRLSMSTQPPKFYADPSYKKKQADITRENWKSGIYNFKIMPLTSRLCKNSNCDKSFLVKPYDSKLYCSKRCSAFVNNSGRKTSTLTKMRISMALKLLPKSKRGKHFSKPKVKLICVGCKKTFELVPYLSKTQKYCSIHCNIVALGRKTTSPKASKGKNGIRMDIDSKINFYSTWEANIARVFNLVGLKWEFSPRIFDLGKHTYRPDFYLPDFDMFVEVKNFLSPYSLERDTLFRQRYPNIKLELILKEDYLNIKSNYKELIDNWEK